MIYIDSPRSYPGKGMYSHMVANTISELHKFAESVDIKKCHFQNKRGRNQPHYDIAKHNYQKCIDAGAMPVDRKFIINFLKISYEKDSTT